MVVSVMVVMAVLVGICLHGAIPGITGARMFITITMAAAVAAAIMVAVELIMVVVAVDLRIQLPVLQQRMLPALPIPLTSGMVMATFLLLHLN